MLALKKKQMGNEIGEYRSCNDNFLGLKIPIPRELIESVIQNRSILNTNSLLQSDWALPSLPWEEIWQYSHEVFGIHLKTQRLGIQWRLLLHLWELAFC